MGANRQPDQRRFQVFVSSTYLDLKSERQAVIATLLECDAFPAGMELFPASDDDSWDLITDVIDDSDYYLLVVGGKYGSIDAVDDISYTEKEFRYAIEQRKPVMAFLHGAPDSLTVELSEKSEDMQKRLARFRATVQESKHVKFWTSPEDLSGKVALSFNKMVRTYPATGWVRADRAASVQTIADLGTARERILALEEELRAIQSAPPPGTEDLSQGSDTVELQVVVRGSYAKRNNLGLVRVLKVLDLRLSWDQILGIVAPVMLVDAPQTSLKEALSAASRSELEAEAKSAVERDALAQDPSIETSKGASNFSLELGDQGFGTILLQLKALGLIEKSDRRTSVNDVETYWRITPLGENRAIQTRAIRK